MFVCLTTVTGQLRGGDPGVELARVLLVPRLEQHHGFAGMMLMVERLAGTALTVSFWENKEALADSEREERQLLEGAGEAFEMPTDVGNFEVLFSTFGAAPTA